MSIWKPKLEGRTGPKYRQLADAIADDIASGVLRPGARMPPHRILAYDLGISPNTTGRAYADCVARALLQGETGRGTFVRILQRGDAAGGVADLRRPSDGPIDLSRNLPFPGPCAAHLARTLRELGASADLQAFLDFQTGPGLPHHIDAGIGWLARTGVRADREEVVITCGAQHGILAALMAATRPGDLLLTDPLTYTSLPMMADHLGLKRQAVAMDDQGMRPEALEAACHRRTVKAVYLTPTLHTPTTATMDDARRATLARIARACDLILIEDDVYGPLRPAPPTPLAAFAPERTITISSTSKCLAPGLRVAFLRAPVTLAPALRRAVTLSCWMPPPLMVEVACRWMADGTADLLTQTQRAEAAAREALAREILCRETTAPQGGQGMRSDPYGFHIWLSLPSRWTPAAFCAEAARQGVKLTDGALFSADGLYLPHAVRISLSFEPDRKRIETGLGILAGVLKTSGSPRSPVI